MTGTPALTHRAIDHLCAVIADLRPDDLARPTPCPDWTVADVLAHLAGTAEALIALAHTGERKLPDELVDLDDPIADTITSLRRLDRTIDDGDTDPDGVARAAGDAAVECTVHAWDLDPRRQLPDDLAASVLNFVSPLVDDTTRATFFGPQAVVSPDASPGAQLVAFLGRTPS